MKERVVTMHFNEDDITNKLKDLLPEDKSILAELISPLIIENDLATSMFFKVMANFDLPDIIPNGTLVEVNPDDIINYQSNASTITVSNISSETEKRVGMIKEFNGYHKYLPYLVEFPQDDGTGMFTCRLNKSLISLIDDREKI